jgi:hypothetical protein
MALFTPLVQAQAKSAAPGARLLQRACGGKKDGECEECAAKKKPQRKAGAGAHPAPAQAGAALMASPQLEQGGARLGGALAGQLGPLFGTDFSSVRVHRDATSAAAAREIGARAFTLGQHIHFGAGQWQPQERSGLHLIAHELSHTLQRAEGSGGSGVEIDAPDSPLEREADHAADAVLAGRATRVGGMGANRTVSRRLLQRAPEDEAKSGGIGTAGGGSETADYERKIDENTTVYVKRTVTERSCTPVPVTKATPDDKIFKWDKDADAISFHYTICNGKVQLSTNGKVDYSKVEESATQLLTTLQKNPALGNNLGGLLQDRLDKARVEGSGDVTLTVDGILQTSVQTTSSASTAGQKVGVKGVLKVTPKGVMFAITGGVDFSRTPLDKATTYTLEGKAATQDFQITLKYEQIDQSRVGGPASNVGTIAPGFWVKIPDTSLTKNMFCGIEATQTIGDPFKPIILANCKVNTDFSKAPEVRCYKCDCPPPLPEYSCNRVEKPHTKPVVDKEAEDKKIKLGYDYNKAVPASEPDFQKGIAAIAGMVGGGFSVESIRGYASPEGSLDAPAKPTPIFKGNIELSQRRADYARIRIAKALPTVTLPSPEGKGELLGDLDGSGDTADADITPRLVELLKPLDAEKRLEVLGVGEQVLGDAQRKAKAIEDIQSFIDGKTAKGFPLAERPRWEKVFPFLRRVEVSLHHDPVTHDEPVKGGNTARCQPDDIADAQANMPPLPPQRRIPKEKCGA